MKRNRILYVSLFLMSLVFVYFYGGKVPYLLFYLTVALPIVSLIYTLIIYLRFKYTQEIDKRLILKGNDVNFIFSINNEDVFLYPYISVTFCGSGTIFAKQFQSRNFSIPPYGKKSFEFKLVCKYRGTYEIGIESIEIQDFLGIIKLKYKVPEPKTITVYPRVVPIERFHLKTDDISESYCVLNTNQEDMATISDVRKYAYGDGLKRIHWKLTAKLNDLMVKKYQSTSTTSATIFLDLRRNCFSAEQNTIIEDKVIEAAIAVIHYCLVKWIPLNLVYYSNELVSIRADNLLMFDEIYNTLAKIKFKESVGIADILNVYTTASINKTNIIVFTSNIDYELYEGIYKASRSSYDTSLVYVSPQDITGATVSDEDNILSFFPEIGVKAYKININDEIKTVLERR